MPNKMHLAIVGWEDLSAYDYSSVRRAHIPRRSNRGRGRSRAPHNLRELQAHEAIPRSGCATSTGVAP